MGRETKILLALLATLAGVFLGVLSMKLLVPRPPVGAGPDVHIDAATAEANALVDPPAFSAAAPAVLAAPGPAAADLAIDEAGPTGPDRFADSRPNPDTDPGDLLPPPRSFAAPTAAGPQTAALDADLPMPPPAVPVATPRRDPFVAPATLEMPMAAAAAPTALAAPRATAEAAADPAATYVTNPGDSWWDLAERAYGDGRLYRALFAWNRVIDPRVSLAPGTRLEIPLRTKLEAAWPKLMPAQ
jgi:5'-nucleotidase